MYHSRQLYRLILVQSVQLIGVVFILFSCLIISLHLELRGGSSPENDMLDLTGEGLLGSRERGAGSKASDKQIFILAGQSNMAGRGSIATGSIELQERLVKGQTRSSSNIFRWTSNNYWEIAREPLHQDIDLKFRLNIKFDQ